MTGKNPTILVLRLEGPMQSWGLRARWDFRDTGSEPSKSGIVGLLGCALGYGKDDARLETELDASLVMAVREERPGVMLVDYQTVTGSHQKAGGGSFKEKTLVTPREYLHDASFVVFLKGPRDLLERCAAALKAPRWPFFLGRKSCPPTRPVFESITDQYSTLEAAVQEYPWDAFMVDPKARPAGLRYVIEDPTARATRADAFRVNPARMYGDRHVREGRVTLPVQKEA